MIRPCKDCLDTPEKYIHIEPGTPPLWRTPRDKNEIMKQILGLEEKRPCEKCLSNPSLCYHFPTFTWNFQQNMPEVLQRESFGLITESTNSLIIKRHIDAMKERPEYMPNFSIKARQVLITCDPNAGGPNEMALVATVCLYGQIIVVGMDAQPVKTAEDSIWFFQEFMSGLRKHPWIDGAWLMFAAETNTGHESGHLVTELKKMKRVYAIREKEDGEYGWRTDNKAKVHYAWSARAKMASDAVFLMKDLVCKNPWVEKEDVRRQKVVEKFYDQMSRYQIVELAQHSAATPARVTTSGKVNQEGRIQAGKNDDLFFTFTMNLGLWEYIINRSIRTLPYETLFT